MSDNAIVDLPKGIINGIAGSILPYKYKDNMIIDDVVDKKIVICIHRDIDKKNIDILSLYGTVLFFEDSFQNINPEMMNFNYLILDFRKEIHRNYYKVYFYKNQNYYFVLYRYWFESNNGISYHNEITDFPIQQSTKYNYDKLLLVENVYEPKWYVSLFRYCCMNKTNYRL